MFKKYLFRTLILCILLTLFSCGSKQDEIDTIKNPNQETNTEKTNTGTVISVLSNYNDIDDGDIENSSFQIKNQILISKAALDNIIPTCKFYEGEIDYIISDGKKVIKKEKNIINDILEGVDFDYDGTQEEKNQEKKNIKKLVAGEIPGKYINFQDKNKISIQRYEGKEESFFDSLGNYMLSIVDNKEFEIYKNIYIDNIIKYGKVTEIDENHIFPLLNAHIYHYKTCKSFLNKYFIEY